MPRCSNCTRNENALAAVRPIRLSLSHISLLRVFSVRLYSLYFRLFLFIIIPYLLTMAFKESVEAM